jgi:hypothetical protein
LAKLLLTRQGTGKARRLRPKIAAAEVREAIGLLRDWCPDANLADRAQSDALCRKMLTVAVAPRVPHPDQDWDLVAVYAGLRGIERGDACVELGLAIKVKPPEPMTLDRQVAMARDIVRTASRHLEAEDEPPPKPELPTPKPKPSPPKPPPPPKKLAWGQLRLVLRLVSNHGKGRRRRLRKRPDPEDVRRVLRLVQERYPETNFHGNPGTTGLACRAFIGTALRRHRPPWHLRDRQSLDLVQAYMDIKGIKDRRAACVELGLHEAVRRPEPARTIRDEAEWPPLW